MTIGYWPICYCYCSLRIRVVQNAFFSLWIIYYRCCYRRFGKSGNYSYELLIIFNFQFDFLAFYVFWNWFLPLLFQAIQVKKCQILLIANMPYSQFLRLFNQNWLSNKSNKRFLFRCTVKKWSSILMGKMSSTKKS